MFHENRFSRGNCRRKRESNTCSPVAQHHCSRSSTTRWKRKLCQATNRLLSTKQSPLRCRRAQLQQGRGGLRRPNTSKR